MGKNDILIRTLMDNKALQSGIGEAGGLLQGFAGKAGLALAGVGAVGGALAVKGFVDAMGRAELDDKFGADIVARSAGLYKEAWGDSVEEVATQMAEAQRAFGDAANLEALTRSAIVLGEKYDTDVSSNIQDAKELMESFGVSGEEAFDLLTVAMEGTTTEVRDEMSSAIREYGDVFAGLGLDANTALGFLTTFGEGGARNLDKAADALKELTIRGSDMSTASKAAFESMGKDQALYAELLLEGGDAASDAMFGIVRGLLEIEDPAEQANAAIALFGTPLEDLGVQQIPQFLEGLQNMRGGLGETAGASEALGDALGDNALARIESFKRRGMEAIVTVMADHVIPVMDRLLDKVEENWPKIQALIEDVSAKVQAVVAEYWPKVQEVIDDVVTWFLEDAWPVIEDVYELVMAGSRRVVELVQQHWPQIQQIVADAVAAVQAIVSRVVAVVSAIWERWGEQILETATRVWANIEEAIGGALDIIQGVFRAFKALFEGDWSALWAAVKQIIDGALTVVVQAIGALWEGVKLATAVAWDLIKTEVWDAIQAIPGLFVDAVGLLWQAGMDLAGEAGKGILEGLGIAGDAIWEWIKGLPSFLLEAIGTVGQTLIDIGVFIAEMIGQGIESALVAIGQAIWSALPDPVRWALEYGASGVGAAADLFGVGGDDGGGNTVYWDPVLRRPSRIDPNSLPPRRGDMPRFADGGRVLESMSQSWMPPGEVMAIVHVGETVVPNGGGGSAPLVGVMNVTSDRDIDSELRVALALRRSIVTTRSLTLTRDSFSVELIHPASDEYPATSGLWLGPSPTLFGAPPVRYDEKALVATAGTQIAVQTHKARDLIIPVVVRVEDSEDLEDVIADIVVGVDPIYSATKTRITYTRRDESARWIDAVLVAGHGAQTVADEESRVTKFVLVFRAEQPYWTDGAEREVALDGPVGADTVDWSDAGTAWSAPGVWWSGAAVSTVGATFTGDLGPAPRWELDGPFTSAEFINDQTGEAWKYTGTVDDGDTLLVDTRPGSMAVTLNGASVWGNMSGTLWRFGVGAETASMTFTGDGANTDVRMFWAPKWLTC